MCFVGERESEKEGGRERERKRDGEEGIKRDGEEERQREISQLYRNAFFKGMTYALAPFCYLVLKCQTRLKMFKSLISDCT